MFSHLLCPKTGEEREEEAKGGTKTPADWVINDLWGRQKHRQAGRGEVRTAFEAIRGVRDMYEDHILMSLSQNSLHNGSCLKRIALVKHSPEFTS